MMTNHSGSYLVLTMAYQATFEIDAPLVLQNMNVLPCR